MSILRLDNSTRKLLSRTPKGGDATTTTLCDLDGNALAPGASPLPVFLDLVSGDEFVQVAERIPNGPTPDDKARAAAIVALNPIHYASPSGDINGYFVEAPDFVTPAPASTNKPSNFAGGLYTPPSN